MVCGLSVADISNIFLYFRFDFYEKGYILFLFLLFIMHILKIFIFYCIGNSMAILKGFFRFDMVNGGGAKRIAVKQRNSQHKNNEETCNRRSEIRSRKMYEPLIPVIKWFPWCCFSWAGNHMGLPLLIFWKNLIILYQTRSDI